MKVPKEQPYMRLILEYSLRKNIMRRFQLSIIIINLQRYYKCTSKEKGHVGLMPVVCLLTVS